VQNIPRLPENGKKHSFLQRSSQNRKSFVRQTNVKENHFEIYYDTIRQFCSLVLPKHISKRYCRLFVERMYFYPRTSYKKYSIFLLNFSVACNLRTFLSEMSSVSGDDFCLRFLSLIPLLTVLLFH
jgi:hypothetical protein